MIDRLLLLLVIGIAALLTVSCQPSFGTAGTPSVAPAPSDTSSSLPTNARQKQVEADGVLLSIGIPAGWHAQKTATGLVLAERYTQIGVDQDNLGIEIHVFVHRLGRYLNPTSDRSALTVLRHVLVQPEYIGNVLVSEPQGFTWDGHDAAYYLMSDGNGALGVVVCFVLLDLDRLVVVNLSTPKNEADALRRRLPELLGSFSVNGITMDTQPLEVLPDPLVFPGSERTTRLWSLGLG